MVTNAFRKMGKSLAISALLAWERAESGVSYNPVSRKIRTYPYDRYDEIRSKDPVHRLRMIDAWVLTRYEDVDTVLRDNKRFSHSSGYYTEYKSFLDLDPPDHTRLRGLTSRAFTPRAVARLESRIQVLVDELLDAVEGKERFDLIEDFAYPLPVTVIAEMLGVPPEDRDRFREWSNGVALSIEPTLDDEQDRIIQKSGESLFAYFEEIIEQRRRYPQEDMISALLAVEDEGDKLTRQELLGVLLLLLVAGNETTRNLIGNGMLALLAHPRQMQLLRDNPDMIGSAIDEMLRYDSPVQVDGRVVVEDVEIGGKLLRPGQRALCLIGAANRDPAVFANPNTLDITRREKSHMSFGRGIHHCLGAPLAILEGRVAFASLLGRFSSLRLAAQPEYQDQVVLRGVKQLWVDAERAPRIRSTIAKPVGAGAGV